MGKAQVEVALDKVELKLLAIAKEVCVRLEKADKFAGQADDHRLAAAIQLAKAREIATAESIPWKAWVAENIPYRSYRDVKRLVAIGTAKDPKAALEGAREKKAAESRVARAGTKLVVTSVVCPGGLSTGDEVFLDDAALGDPLSRCQAVFEILDYDQKKEFLEWAQKELEEEEAPLDFEAEEAGSHAAYLSQDDETAGPEPSVGGISDEELLDIPPHLRRI